MLTLTFHESESKQLKKMQMKMILRRSVGVVRSSIHQHNSTQISQVNQRPLALRGFCLTVVPRQRRIHDSSKSQRVAQMLTGENFFQQDLLKRLESLPRGCRPTRVGQQVKSKMKRNRIACSNDTPQHSCQTAKHIWMRALCRRCQVGPSRSVLSHWPNTGLDF